MTRVLMTQGDPAADTAIGHLISSYGIELVFCASSGAEVLRCLRQTHYDAVILRSPLQDLALHAVKQQYELYFNRIGLCRLLPEPETLFFALLEHPDAAVQQSLKQAGFAGLLIPPLSEYKLAMAVLDSTRETLLRCQGRELELRLEIQQLLLQLGCPSHLKGTAYLCECLVCLAQDPNTLYMATKVLYPQVAARMNTSATNLERSMRTALEHLWSCGAPESPVSQLPGLFQRQPGAGRISVTRFLGTVSQCLELHKRA